MDLALTLLQPLALTLLQPLALTSLQPLALTSLQPLAGRRAEVKVDLAQLLAPPLSPPKGVMKGG